MAKKEPIETPRKKRPETDLADRNGETDVKRKRRLGATRMEAIRWDPDRVFRENPYYIRIANKYRILKYITIVLALVFAVSMMTAFSQDITTENFQYLLKDLDLSGLILDDTFDSLLYNGGSESSFGIYRGELAVVSPGTVGLYKPSGALSLSKTNIFYNPALLTSAKYFLVYDRGETSRAYSVFNSFAELKTETYEYPITGAAIADNGTYALVTRDDTFRGIIRVYNANFKQILEIKKDKYVLSVDFSADGKTLVIASVYDQNGDFAAEITTVDLTTAETGITVTKLGAMPLKVRFMKNGLIGVIYNDGAVVYNADGSDRVKRSYASLSSVSAAIGDDFICTVYSTSVVGHDKTIDVYNADGRRTFTAEVAGELLYTATSGKQVCLLFEDRAVLIDTISGQMKAMDIAPNAIEIVFSGDIPIACYSGNAMALRFDEADA